MSSIPPPPTGIYPPCVTFMNEDESIDLDSITSHVLRLAKGGVTGLVLQGSNGEAVHLNHSERSIIIKHVRKCLDDNGYEDTPIIAGCGAASSHETLLLAREAGEAGASYALILPPSYWAGAMNKTVLASYFKDIADKSPIPILLYNFPLVANGVSLDSDTMIELAQHDKIVGVKLTCGVSQVIPRHQSALILQNIGNLHRVAAHTDRSTFAVMSGKSEFAMHGFVGGASACIAALVNL